MAIDVNSAVGQVETANNTLAAYFSDLSAAVSDTSGATPIPDISPVMDSLSYTELLRMTTTRASDSPSYENGAAIENVHMMAAILREYALRNKGKLDYYTDAGAEFMDESNLYSTLKVYWVSMMNGIYKEGS